MTTFRARSVWTPSGLRTDTVVELDDAGRVRSVRPARDGDGPTLDGMIVPGLVNAHTHVELSWAAGRVAGGHGFLAWVRELMGQQGSGGAERGARMLHASGCGWVVDVSNTGTTAAALTGAGVPGVVAHELLGFDARDVPKRAAVARAHGAGRVRPAPHALFSTAPDLVHACVTAGDRRWPSTIHVGEAEDEARFLATGDGPLALLLDQLGRDWRWWSPPGRTALQVLDELGVLGPDLLLVHGVRLGADDRALAAARRAPLVVCGRSNLHIGGTLPDVPAWLAAGVAVCLGTDSLASAPDLDVLGEIPVLAAAFPTVAPERWLAMVTHDAADAVRAPEAGRLEVGRRPGLLLLEQIAGPADLLEAPPARRWLAAPGGCAPGAS